jgi:hypothetical protein
MQDSETAGDMASMARETFEHGVVPWSGRAYADWVRAWSAPYPGDPRGMVQIPEHIYQAFLQRTPGERLTRRTAEQLGYPKVPGGRKRAM